MKNINATKICKLINKFTLKNDRFSSIKTNESFREQNYFYPGYSFDKGEFITEAKLELNEGELHLSFEYEINSLGDIELSQIEVFAKPTFEEPHKIGMVVEDCSDVDLVIRTKMKELLIKNEKEQLAKKKKEDKSRKNKIKQIAAKFI